MNITSTGGSGSTHRWLIATVPSTVLINNFSTGSSSMFSVTEDTSLHTNLSGFKIQDGGGAANDINFNYTSGGQAILLHDCWIEGQNGVAAGGTLFIQTNRGVIWNCSFDSSPFSQAPLLMGFRNAPISSWTTPSTWGAADTTGQGNFYVETNDFHAWLNAPDMDDNARVVWRYN